ncbi:MAG: GLUG motif-containing protein [Planctomycetota bacterium]|nr:GLUG motif-containing protein [Planctomycetota bacterium]
MGANERRRLAWALVLFGISFFVAPIQADEGFIRTGCYVFEPVRSTIVQTGGFAGVHWTYAVEGRFCLILDADEGTARFERIDANAVDASEPVRTLDPNAVFNLTALAGDVAGETIEFAGQTDDGSSVHLTLAFADDTVHLTGQTTPPPNSADFFLFSIDAVATRKYAGGTGDPNTPYQIATAEQMNAIGTCPEDWDKHFQLTADIDLSAYRGTEFNIIAPDASVPFRGTFDGGGHTIAGFSYEVRQADHIALFGVVADPNARIENLTLADPNVKVEWGQHTASLVAHLREGLLRNCHASGGTIQGVWFIGGLVGQSGYLEPNDGTLRTSATIVNCSYQGTVQGSFTMIGGLVGRDYNGTVRHCYATGEVTGESDTGGLIGESTCSMIVGCYSTCTVTGGNRVGGLVGRAFVAEVVECYATGPVTGNGEIGGLLTDMSGDSRRVRASFWDVERSGQTTSAGGEGKTTVEMQNPQTFINAGWDFIGHDDGPSDIWAEPEDGGYPILWWQLSQLPALPFAGGTGTANDPYHIATAEQLNSIGCNPRLMTAHFRMTEDFDLKGISVHRIGSEYLPYGGVFDGGGFTISNFTYTATDSLPVGLFQVVDGFDRMAEVRDLRFADPNVRAQTARYVGTLAGAIGSAVLRNCHIDGGQLVGHADVGGLAGLNGRWTHQQGERHGTIVDCRANATVTGQDFVGGLVGTNSRRSTITDCHTGGITIGTQGVGGLVGANSSGTIVRCSSGGTVCAERSGGGVAGGNPGGTVRECVSRANVSGRYQIGGLAGTNYGIIANCYARGNVSGDQIIGGLVGCNGFKNPWEEDPGNIFNCYAGGNVSGDTPSGGLVGVHESGTISNCFWDREASGRLSSAGGTGLTTAQMQTAATFLGAGWDFVGETANGTDDIWWILEGQDYPRLWWETGEE